MRIDFQFKVWLQIVFNSLMTTFHYACKYSIFLFLSIITISFKICVFFCYYMEYVHVIMRIVSVINKNAK